LITSVAGIGVAGVVGPMATAWATRRANRQQFERDQAASRRGDLRSLIDEASALLGSGATNLRTAKESLAARAQEPPEVSEWAMNVHLLKQRLLLRLPPSDPVMSSYEAVLETLEAISKTDGGAYIDALRSYESAHGAFLEAARVALASPIGSQD
jgi:hypothetical protein